MVKRCGQCRKRNGKLARMLDRIGIDPFDVCMEWLRTQAERLERSPVSRFVFGSPCRFVKTIDFACHVLLPEMLLERYPRIAEQLSKTSPRWGHVAQTDFGITT